MGRNGLALLVSSVNRTAIATSRRSRLGSIEWMLSRICRARGIRRPLIVTWLKWQMEGVGNFRPKLPRYVPGHVGADADSGSFGHGAQAPFVAGMIEIAQGFGAHGSKPFGVVGHQVAGIAVRHKGMPQGVSKPLVEAAMSQPVITRILPEY